MSDLQNDIIKYKKGELSPKEMHALEKKALSDPFLADALEGLENIPLENFARDAAELNQRILKQRKTILFTPLRIASGVILITTSVIVFYQLMPEQKSIALKNEKSSTHPVSKQKSATEPKQEPKETEKVVESKKEESPKTQGAPIAKSKSVEIKPQESETKSEEVAKKETSKSNIEAPPSVADAQTFAAPEKKADEIETSKEVVAPSSIAMRPVQHVAQDQDAKKERVSARSKKFEAKSEVASGAGFAKTDEPAGKSISGKVVSADDGSPLPGVNVVVEGTTDGTVTDASGTFTLKTSGENQKLMISFIGLQSQEVNIEGKDKVDVELKTDVSQLSEIVVTGVGVKRDDDAEPIVHLASPIGGMRAYNKYLNSNVHYPQEALNNNIKGKVKVEFSVNTDGSLDDYKIVKGLGFGCDEEVVRLIKDGPKWSASTENGQPVESTVLVGVKFDPAKLGR